MPNCDYYATAEDHRAVLDWLFSSHAADVYELASEYEKPLRQFSKTDDVIRLFENRTATGESWHTVHLQLMVRGAGLDFKPTYVKLDPKVCHGAKFRYGAEGIGLIQLYLSVPRSEELENSHTNHFTGAGAGQWVGISTDARTVSKIDFKAIASFSGKLNRQIRNLAVAKIGGRILTKSALELWNQGFRLAPFDRSSSEEIILT
jgi:hypothetical protein